MQGTFNIETAFSNPAPSNQQTQRIDRVLNQAKPLAELIVQECGGPESPEVQLALTRLAEATAFAKLAIMTTTQGHAGSARG